MMPIEKFNYTVSDFAKIINCNTTSSQCYADYFCGVVTNVNGAALGYEFDERVSTSRIRKRR
jgi:hypothetical protein